MIRKLDTLEDKPSLLRALVELYTKAYEGLEKYAYTDPKSIRNYLLWLTGERGKGKFFRKGHIFLLREEGGVPISFIAGDSLWEDSELGRVANFHELVVHPEKRGRGIGREMVISLIRHFFLFDPKERDVMLWVGIDNYPAMSLYKALGFEERGVKGIWLKMVMPFEKVKQLLGGEGIEREDPQLSEGAGSSESHWN